MKSHKLEDLASPLWQRAYAQDVDRISFEKYHLDPLLLMEAAGKALAKIVFDLADNKPVISLVGPGNNGGDALVCARYLLDWGIREQHIVMISAKGYDDSKFTPLLKKQLEIIRALGLSVDNYSDGYLKKIPSGPLVIVDGVLGLGFSGGLKKDDLIFKALSGFEDISNKKVVAVDVPTGLDVDRGDPQIVPLPAGITVTFGGLKPAQIISPARENCGLVTSIDIGFPLAAQKDALKEHDLSYFLLDPGKILKINPWDELGQECHKFSRGHVLIIGGSPGKTGAPVLSAMACLRAGAGWATVSLPQDAGLDISVPPEVTFENLFEKKGLSAEKLRNFLGQRNVKTVAIGPGFMSGQLDEKSLAVLAEFTEKSSGFVVLDAGATVDCLSLFKTRQLSPNRWLLTPHPGEWQKMGDTLKSNPLTISGLKETSNLVQKIGLTLMYKSATPLVVSGEEGAKAFVSNAGSNILARAGSGDVLTGIIAAHGAMGLSAPICALRGYALMAKAGEMAAIKFGKHSVLATDLIKFIGI